MSHYLYIRTQNGIPIERSLPIESEELPTLLSGWDEVWTETQWDVYIASIPVQIIITPESATQVSDFYEMAIYNYDAYRTRLKAIVEALGGGDESVGFTTLNATEQEFVALNGIGTKTQIDSVLTEPTKQTIDFLTSKQALK